MTSNQSGSELKAGCDKFSAIICVDTLTKFRIVKQFNYMCINSVYSLTSFNRFDGRSSGHKNWRVRREDILSTKFDIMCISIISVQLD